MFCVSKEIGWEEIVSTMSCNLLSCTYLSFAAVNQNSFHLNVGFAHLNSDLLFSPPSSQLLALLQSHDLGISDFVNT